MVILQKKKKKKKKKTFINWSTKKVSWVRRCSRNDKMFSYCPFFNTLIQYTMNNGCKNNNFHKNKKTEKK